MEEHNIDCPYCGESISVLVDASAGDQTYYEDCSVCCQAILFEAHDNFESEIIKLTIKRDDE